MMTYRKREQSPPYERGDHAHMDEADANVVGLTEKPDYNKEVSVLSDEEQNRIKSEVCMQYALYHSSEIKRLCLMKQLK